MEVVSKADKPSPKKELTPNEEALKQLLESHDWYYEYSDDFNKWKAGSTSWGKIHHYRSLVGDKVFVEMYNEEAPTNMQIKSLSRHDTETNRSETEKDNKSTS